MRRYHYIKLTAHMIVQEALEQDNPGATIVPIIISTDKTLLTQFRNKNAYPVYLTIGNIPKEIRRKPSCRAYVLLGYLPTTRLENEANKASRRRQLANLYHSCMSKILHPLKHAGESGIFMTTGDGVTHRNHPLLACFAGDYPEQVLTTAIFTGECPVCPTPRNHLGEYDCNNPAAL
jgi:Plavaka transposase